MMNTMPVSEVIEKVADVCKVKTSCTHLQRYLALDYAAINQIDNP